VTGGSPSPAASGTGEARATLTVHAHELRAYAAGILSAAGLPAPDADVVAAALVDANMRGIDSHGVTRVPIYVDRLRRGLVNPEPDIRIVRDAGAALVVDGDNGMGAVVTSRAMDIGLERLGDVGSVSVAIRHTNHYSSGAYYMTPALDCGAVAFLYANAPSTTAAWGGVQRYLGTNPYTFASPTGRHGPFVLDMATSVVARGKILLAAQRGESIPEGWAVDAAGNPTTDAHAALEGAVLPFGGAKGYGIAMMIEVLAGVLSGANVGPGVGDLYEDLDKPQGVGSFLQLIDVAAFQPLDQFLTRIDAFIDEIKATGSPENGHEVLVPGEIESRTAAARADAGIPLSPDVVQALERVAPAGLAAPRGIDSGGAA
jgi:LDH2 family malate/lactate/ureidoglycolate dehydrogenase